MQNKTKICFYGIYAIGFVFVLLLFICRYYNLGAESIGIVSLMRVADGLSHISQAGEMPSLLSPYGAFYFWIIGKLFYLIGVSQLDVIAIFGRLVTLASTFFVTWYSYKHIVKDETKKIEHFLFIPLFYIAFPFAGITVRSDWIAFVFEFLGFFYIWQALEKDDFKKVIYSALLFGIAPLFKLNSIGVLVGVGLYLLFKKKWKELATMVVLTGVTASMGVGISYLFFGKNYLLQVIHTANHGVFPLSGIPGLIKRIVVDLIFYKQFMWIIFAVGFMKVRPKYKHANLVAISIVINFLMASVFQLKIGAGDNYFLSSFLLMTFFFADGVKEIVARFQDPDKAFVSFVTLFSLVIVMALKGMGVLKLSGNNLVNYPYVKAHKYLIDKYGKAPVYTDNPNAAVLFYPNVILGPWDYLILRDSKYYYKNHYQEVKQKVSEIDFKALITVGSGCENKIPTHEFAPKFTKETSTLTKFKKICIFENSL